MKVLYAKCENGHFFDANSSEKCPKCSSSVYTLLGEKQHKKSDKEAKESREEKEEAKLKKHEKKAEKHKKNETLAEQPDMEAAAGMDNAVNAEPVMTDEDSKTLSFSSNSVKLNSGGNATVKLEGAVKTVSENNEEKKDDNKTVAFWDKNTDVQTEPVVGWLVCIKGAEAGQNYVLKTGANKVGRLASVNDVVVAEDPQISRKEHIVITFEPKQKRFYIQQGEGMGLAYLNGELICGSGILNERDRIEIGASTFVFVPLCGDKFDWND